jgi:hypothetical protein
VRLGVVRVVWRTLRSFHFDFKIANSTNNALQNPATPAYRPGQIQVVGDRFPESCQIPYQKCKSHCELGRPRLLTDLPVSIQYWIQNLRCGGFGNRPAATGTVDWAQAAKKPSTRFLTEISVLRLHSTQSVTHAHPRPPTVPASHSLLIHVKVKRRCISFYIFVQSVLENRTILYYRRFCRYELSASLRPTVLLFTILLSGESGRPGCE